jgi:uncharacterized protein
LCSSRIRCLLATIGGSRAATGEGPTLDISDRYSTLLARLGELESVLVAYSGGVDSTLLAVAAHAVLGDACAAALATSDTCPTSEIVAARSLASHLGLTLVEIETNELVDPAFRENTPDRCYHCKFELFGLLRDVADSHGFVSIADGSNADDLSDYRPGSRAAAEFGVVSPLAETGFSKSDIREIARLLDLPNWDKPSMACLASRFPYGEPITEKRLAMVASAEDVLRELGLRQFRVRAHGNVARLEVAPAEMDFAWRMRDSVANAIRAAGFAYVTQDLEGYRTGALNETL